MKMTTGPWRSPARSPDLTLPDFFLWGYIKNQMNATAVHIREDMKERVRTAYTDILKVCINLIISTIIYILT